MKPGEYLYVDRRGQRYILNGLTGTHTILPPHIPRGPSYGERLKQHPATWYRHRKPQMIWPRDKKQKGAHTWGRLADILTGNGPDIWIGRQYSRGPHRPVWSGWTTKGRYPRDALVWDNLGYPYRKDNTVLPPSWACRGDEERYDFKSRRYRRPRAGVWSDVKWSNDKPHVPLYHRDRYGLAVVEPEVDGGHFNAELARNPFGFNRRIPEWDWNIGDAYGW